MFDLNQCTVLFIDHSVIMGFEPLVNQRLLPPTFPRYCKIVSREEAVQYLSKLMSRLNMIFDVVECTNLHVAFVSIVKPGLSIIVSDYTIECRIFIAHFVYQWNAKASGADMCL